MSAAFDRAIGFVLPHETEFRRGHWGEDAFVLTEHVAGDGGGATRYGIDQRSHPGVPVNALTRAQAIELYRREWNAHALDLLPERLAIAAFDVWVNGGTASLWLQRAFNRTHRFDADLKEDGQLGPVSLKALRGADEYSILEEFIRQRDERFRRLAENPSQRKFLEGWLTRDRDLRSYLLA
jgi:lysozyme family protein